MMLFCLWFVLVAVKAAAITGLMWWGDLPYANAVGWLGWFTVLVAIDVWRVRLPAPPSWDMFEQAEFE